MLSGGHKYYSLQHSLAVESKCTKQQNGVSDIFFKTKEQPQVCELVAQTHSNQERLSKRNPKMTCISKMYPGSFLAKDTSVSSTVEEYGKPKEKDQGLPGARVRSASPRSGARGWVSGEGKQVRDGGQASQAVASVLSEAGAPQSWGQPGDSDQAHLCRQLH